jgi:transposase InsO family protein
MLKNIVCRHGVPDTLISDNGMQFVNHKIAEFCAGLSVTQVFSSVEHPQINGQAEAANKVILNGLKK